jgi:hypothetical protein
MAMTSWRNGLDMMCDGWPVYVIDRVLAGMIAYGKSDGEGDVSGFTKGRCC